MQMNGPPSTQYPVFYHPKAAYWTPDPRHTAGTVPPKATLAAEGQQEASAFSFISHLPLRMLVVIPSFSPSPSFSTLVSNQQKPFLFFLHPHSLQLLRWFQLVTYSGLG